MSQPRIATFARLANGNVTPKRIISGQVTKLGRTIHGIVYSPKHDEYAVGDSMADAVLIFDAGAHGAVPPKRIIQGPHTDLFRPHAVSYDPAHDELLVAALNGNRVSVFPWTASGDVRPLRELKGKKTMIGHSVGMAVDPAHGLLAIANDREVLIFNRTDNGDVPPRAVIGGPKTGIGEEPWTIELYGQKLFLASSNHIHENVYSGVTLKGTYKEVPPEPWYDPNLGFIGVWNITDNGDVPPQAIIRGPFSGILHPTGMAINPKDGEIYVSDSVRNGLFTFLVPDWFQKLK